MGRRLLFDFAADAGEFGRGFVVESAVGKDFVAEGAEEIGEVGDLIGELANLAPFGAHGGGRAQGDLAPFGGAVNDEDDVANLGGFEGGAGDAGFLDERGDLDQAGEIEAAADAAEFADFGGRVPAEFRSTLDRWRG